MESPDVIAEPTSRRDGVGQQSVAAVLRGFQPANRGCRTPRGVGDRSANPQIAVRFAPPPAGCGLRLGSGPRIPDRRAQSGREAADGSLPSHFAASARWLLLFPGAGSSLGESAANRAAARGTGDPSQGWDSHARYSVGSCSPRAGALPALRPGVHGAEQPRRVRGPCAELPAEGGGGGGSRGFFGSFCPEEPVLARRGPPEGRGDTATDTCLPASAPARARRSEQVRLLAAGWAATPAPHSRAPPSAPPPRRQSLGTGSPGFLPRSRRARARGWGPGTAWRAAREVPGSWRHPSPGSVRVVALGAEAPRAPGGLWSATGFSAGLLPAAAAASGHTHPRSHSKNQSDRGPEYPRRGEATFPGLPRTRPLPPQRHAWLRRRETLLMPRGWGGVPDDRLRSSGPRQARLRDLEGQGTQSGLYPLKQRPVRSLVRVKNPQWQALFAKVAAFPAFHPLLSPH